MIDKELTAEEIEKLLKTWKTNLKLCIGTYILMLLVGIGAPIIELLIGMSRREVGSFVMIYVIIMVAATVVFICKVYAHKRCVKLYGERLRMLKQDDKCQAD